MKTENIKTSYKIAFGIVIVCLVFSIGNSIYRLISGLFPAMTILTLLLDLAILYYLTAGYKKPHGDMLKYLFLFLALTLTAKGARSAFYYVLLPICLNCAAVIIAFVSGRLNRFDENRILLSVALAFLLTALVLIAVFFPSSFVSLLGMSGGLELIALSGAYFVRFAAHREAGLAEDRKTESI